MPAEPAVPPHPAPRDRRPHTPSQHTSSHAAEPHSAEHSPTARPPAAAPALGSATPDDAGCHVLLVDDNPVSRAALRTALTTPCVTEAADTRQAHEAALHHRPDVVLLDTHAAAPGTDQDLTDLLRLAPTLLLTRREDNEVLQRALRLGALGYLVHGDFTAEELGAAVDAVRAAAPVTTTGPELRRAASTDL
ncbi:response regulator transcription factor [Streptomyces sp. OF3]|uniref:Response regulator transcription factor n=1 Tax=Streptomyces alkaliterrae TaxID=2213162 RepID=A0A7W3WPL4_9ACTN|nr:response regulator [Streptomyces alkaliterrae]MBB1256188.1 response regulator transcription factor [Streptomyces alkaliterrae]